MNEKSQKTPGSTAPASTDVLHLCWWEYEALLMHLRSRADLWVESSDMPGLWMRLEPRQDEDAAFTVFFAPPKDATSLFRQYGVHIIPARWNAEEAREYLLWLINHWTGYRERQIAARFLECDLHIDHVTAGLSAIALTGLAYQEDDTPEPSTPPLQEELWPRDDPPSFDTDFISDPTLIGTYLLAGSAGWLQLRRFGGMIKASIMLRGKDGVTKVPLQGLVRPMNGRVRDAVSEITGKDKPHPEPLPPGDGVSTCFYNNEDCRGEVVQTTGLCEAHSGLLDEPEVK